MMKSVVITLGFLVGLSATAELDDDEFELLPTGVPTCLFTSSITRTKNEEIETLHKAAHSETSESGFDEALKRSCAACRKALSKAVSETRKKGFAFFQDKCFFERCSYGRSEAPVEMADSKFRAALAGDQEAFYCVKRP